MIRSSKTDSTGLFLYSNWEWVFTHSKDATIALNIIETFHTGFTRVSYDGVIFKVHLYHADVELSDKINSLIWNKFTNLDEMLLYAKMYKSGGCSLYIYWSELGTVVLENNEDVIGTKFYECSPSVVYGEYHYKGYKEY